MRSALIIVCAAALCATSVPANAASTCGGPKQPPCDKTISDGAAKGQASEGVYGGGGGSGGGKPGPTGMAVKGEGADTGGPPCKARRGHPCASTITPPTGQAPGRTPG